MPKLSPQARSPRREPLILPPSTLSRMRACLPEYPSFAALTKSHVEGRDFDRVIAQVAGAKVAIIAPHGGRIEPRTNRIAAALAGTDFSLYCFISRLPKHQANLHIRSHRFNDPACLAIVNQHDFVVAVHGWSKEGEAILVGGLDVDLGSKLAAEARALEIATYTESESLAGTDPMNICNRSKSHRGVQLELSMALRRSSKLEPLIASFRAVLLEHAV